MGKEGEYHERDAEDWPMKSGLLSALVAVVAICIVSYAQEPVTWAGADTWFESEDPVVLVVDGDDGSSFRGMEPAELTVEGDQVSFSGKFIYIFGQLPVMECTGDVEANEMVLSCRIESPEREFPQLILARQ
jgi:hypothetical protein